MIICHTGMPGGGKSASLTYQAYKAMKKGRPVYSNFFIKGTYKITFEDLCNYAFPQGSVVIIDEAGRWFNSRTWERLPSDIFDLFTMHRHMELDLYIGVQNFNRIDKSLREVIELTYWVRNVSYLPFFIHDGYYDLEKVGVMKDSDITKYVWKRKKIFNLYDTYGMKSEWNEKEEMPQVPWEWEEVSRETLFDKVKRKWYTLLNKEKGGKENGTNKKQG